MNELASYGRQLSTVDFGPDMRLNSFQRTRPNGSGFHGTNGPPRLPDKYAKLFIPGKELAPPSRRGQSATYYPQNVSIPPSSKPQHILTNQDVLHLSDNRHKTLAEWVGVITKVCSDQTFDSEEYFAKAIKAIIEGFKASTATCAYALAIFRRLWRTGDNIHKELRMAISKARILSKAVKRYPTEVLVLAFFYLALWAANVTLNDEADSFWWFNFLEADRSQRKRFEIAVLTDLQYNTLLPSYEWKHHLNSLLWASQPLTNNPKFHFILTGLKIEIERASSKNNSV